MATYVAVCSTPWMETTNHGAYWASKQRDKSKGILAMDTSCTVFVDLALLVKMEARAQGRSGGTDESRKH